MGIGLHGEMAGRVVEWFWMAKCHRNCWNVRRIISVFSATKSEVCDVAYLAVSIYLLALTAGVTDINVFS